MSDDLQTWYDNMYADALDCEESYESKWEGQRIRSPQRRYDVVATIDAILDGTWTPPIPQPRPVSLNRAFDESVREYKSRRAA